jgi:hypothetical protein
MRIWISIFTLLLGLGAQAERRHSIELSGALADPSTKTLTVESLTKDFPSLSTVDTEWRDEGKHQFKGVSMQDFVKKYAAPGVTKAKVTATNDYSQPLTAKDWNDWGALLAFQEDGKVITTKNKGTFRIVYPYQKFDKDLSVKSMLESNSVWQVIKVEFIK